jgi:hypothetical protein
MEKIYDSAIIHTVADNNSSAFVIRVGAAEYIVVDSTNGSEIIEIGEDIQRDSASRDLSYQLKSEIMDDMFGRATTATENNPQWVLNSGADAQALDPAIDNTQAGGVFKLVTGDLDGTTASDGSGMVWSGVPVQFNSTNGVTIIEARVRIKSGITFCSVGFGLTDATTLIEPFTGSADVISLTAPTADAVGFLFDSNNTTQEWFGCAADTSSLDVGNSTTGVAPVQNVWQILRIEISSNGVTINFFVDNSSAADLTMSGSFGVGPDVVLYPYIIANTTAGTPTSRTIDVDYIRIETIR